jgi:peptidoglycan/LPS O-acetylase OafA/YrhL
VAAEPRRIDALTGLRFVAAVHVVLLHLTPSASVGRMPQALKNFFQTGFLGVSLFFVLYGFILAYTYLPAEAGPGEIDRRKFWTARVARVYPVYVFGLLVSAPFFFAWVADKMAENHSVGVLKGLVVGVSNVLLLQAWTPYTNAQWNFPGWSLSVEAFFYLIFPWVIVRAARQSQRSLLRMTALTVFVSVLVPTLVVLLLKLRFDAVAFGPNATPAMANLSYVPAMRLPEFVLGLLAGVHFRRFSSSRLKRPGIIWLTVGGILFTIAVANWIPTAFIRLGIVAPLFALLIYLLAMRGGTLARVLGSRWIVVLGEASYALYILHIPVAQWMEKLAGVTTQGEHAWRNFAVYFCVLITISVTVYYVIERPARRLIRSLATTASAADSGLMPVP